MGKNTGDILLEKDKNLYPEVRMINLLMEIGNTIDKDIWPKKVIRYNPWKILTFWVDDEFFMGKHTGDIQLEKDKELHPEVRMINHLLEIGNTTDEDIQPQKRSKV